jgi:DNA-binding PadR family transcriptional regulator
MIPLYILGLLQRYGPQHGYQIKKIISEQLADFTQIKLPAIYYHLEKMAENGLLSAECEKSGSRPEKTVYSVTEKGKQKFTVLLEQQLSLEYRPLFSSDSVFYFSEYLDTAHASAHLKDYCTQLDNTIQAIEKHRTESMSFIPEPYQPSADIIFCHHLTHYRAERSWAEEALSLLNKQKKDTIK